MSNVKFLENNWTKEELVEIAELVRACAESDNDDERRELADEVTGLCESVQVTEEACDEFYETYFESLNCDQFEGWSAKEVRDEFAWVGEEFVRMHSDVLDYYSIELLLLQYKKVKDNPTCDNWAEVKTLLRESNYERDEDSALTVFNRMKNRYYAGEFGYGDVVRDDELEFLVLFDHGERELTIDFHHHID